MLILVIFTVYVCVQGRDSLLPPFLIALDDEKAFIHSPWGVCTQMGKWLNLPYVDISVYTQSSWLHHDLILSFFLDCFVDWLLSMTKLHKKTKRCCPSSLSVLKSHEKKQSTTEENGFNCTFLSVVLFDYAERVLRSRRSPTSAAHPAG